MSVTRVLLGDGHRFFVEALAMRLDVEPGLQVVGTVVRPEEAVRALQAREADVAVLAVDGDAAGFLAVAPALQAARPDLALVGVSGEDDLALLTRAVRVGFRGWVAKDVGIGALLQVLEGVSHGETRIPPRLLTGVLGQLLADDSEQRAAELPFASLTVREHEVLRAMCGGASRQEIAGLLAISPNTVRTHMQSILNKLGVHTSLAAVSLARRAGIS